MMSLNKFVAVAFLLVTASFQVEAQGGGGGMRGAGGAQQQQRIRELMFKDITLDEAQTKKIDSIQTATMAKRQEMMQAARGGGGGGGGMQAMREQMQTMQAEERKAIRDLLTPEQQTQFDKNVENMPAPGAGRRPPPTI